MATVGQVLNGTPDRLYHTFPVRDRYELKPVAKDVLTLGGHLAVNRPVGVRPNGAMVMAASIDFYADDLQEALGPTHTLTEDLNMPFIPFTVQHPHFTSMLQLWMTPHHDEVDNQVEFGQLRVSDTHEVMKSILSSPPFLDEYNGAPPLRLHYHGTTGHGGGGRYAYPDAIFAWGRHVHAKRFVPGTIAGVVERPLPTPSERAVHNILDRIRQENLHLRVFRNGTRVGWLILNDQDAPVNLAGWNRSGLLFLASRMAEQVGYLKLTNLLRSTLEAGNAHYTVTLPGHNHQHGRAAFSPMFGRDMDGQPFHDALPSATTMHLADSLWHLRAFNAQNNPLGPPQ